MLNNQTVEVFETEAKRKFIEEPAQMKLLIVVDKLLTGFDAPPCTYLYIDKSMQDHGLFQAICRVNRLYDGEKDFGYIVDYKQLFGDLATALNKYTSGAFEGYATEDIEGLIKDRLGEAKNTLMLLWKSWTISVVAFPRQGKNCSFYTTSAVKTEWEASTTNLVPVAVKNCINWQIASSVRTPKSKARWLM